jgi:hypothetical protein
MLYHCTPLIGFEKMIRYALVSILVGAKEEIRHIQSIMHLKEVLDSFARNLSLSRLQGLLAQHFMKEMKELFDLSDNLVTELSLRSSYPAAASDNDILGNIYRQLKR